MQYLSIRRLALPLIASIAACGGDPVDLGEDRVVGSALSDYAGTWDGYAEAFEFSDDTDGVHLVMGADGTGELWLGEADPLPAPEADHAYPPGTRTAKETLPSGAVAGFGYPIADGEVDDNRLRMHSRSGEVYREWCDLQTPHLVVNATPSYYACLPFSGYGTNESGECTNGPELEDVIDCGLADCLTRCECSEDACAVAPNVLTPDMRVDATLEGEGDSFVGTLVLGSERITVRLTRVNGPDASLALHD
ncbi:MAG TPA: hypothetical protein VK509_09735 [Polyangiales bacterium]|nr:hypothetical protein [Polyangiales bacterium]